MSFIFFVDGRFACFFPLCWALSASAPGARPSLNVAGVFRPPRPDSQRVGAKTSNAFGMEKPSITSNASRFTPKNETRGPFRGDRSVSRYFAICSTLPPLYYIRGLKPRTRKEVEIREPVSYDDATRLAEKLDVALSCPNGSST